jgi:hypothetical protein
LSRTIVAGAALGLLAANPAQADSMSKAEQLRRMDIMLMVTGLRCRTTTDNFQADYGRFTTNHIAELNAASNELRAELARTSGAAGSARALDKLSVTMANSYGQGHPWLSCHELKQVAQNLAEVHGRATLEEAAEQLLAPSIPARFAFAGR